MNYDQKIIKEALELIERLNKLEATSLHIRQTAMKTISAMRSDVAYDEVPIPGVADLIALASSAKDVGTRLDCYLMLAAEQ
jgi:hypothetical protein